MKASPILLWAALLQLLLNAGLSAQNPIFYTRCDALVAQPRRAQTDTDRGVDV